MAAVEGLIRWLHAYHFPTRGSTTALGLRWSLLAFIKKIVSNFL
jgi:hypothetical protein